MDTINERSSAYLTVNLTDKTGAPAIPVSASYRIWCVTNGVEVRPASVLANAASVEIPLTAADNAIINPKKAYETRMVTVDAIFSTDDEVHSTFPYRVRNLAGL